MPRAIQEPVTVDERDGTKTTHPAFGQITVSRVQGSIDLYGSDFTHHHFVQVEIHRSELHRNLSRDWHFARETLCALAMSESQWATFVSSFNLGSGTPVTIDFVDGHGVPGLPPRKSWSLYRDEVTKDFAETLDGLKKLRDQVSEIAAKAPKKMQVELTQPIQDAINTLESRLPFIYQSFDEHMENTVEKAKVEVNAYAGQTLMRAGLSALQAVAPLAIESDKK